MDKLPVVDALVGVLCSILDTLPQEDRELADVGEGELVREVNLLLAGEEEERRRRVLHQGDGGEGVDARLAGGGEEGRVDALEDGLAEGVVGGDGELAKGEEGGDADRVGSRVVEVEKHLRVGLSQRTVESQPQKRNAP